MTELDDIKALLAAEFVQKTHERVERIQLLWLAIENDKASADDVDDLMRELHSLKGESRMMDHPEICYLAHRGETLVLHERKVGFRHAQEAGALLLALTGLVVELLEGRGASTRKKLDALIRQLDARLGVSQLPPPAPDDASELGDGSGEESPGPDDEPQEAAADNVAKGDERAPALQFFRVPAATIASFGDLAVENAVQYARLAQALDAIRATAVHAKQMEQALGSASQSQSPALHQALERIADDLTTLETAVGDGAAMAGELEVAARELRRVPVRTVFAGFAAGARKLATEHDKEARFELVDGGIQIDKAVADGLSESLLHLVRNCVSHGIETPAERTKAGKPSQGTVSLLCAETGGFIKLCVADDGRGIDLRRVRARARRLGWEVPDDEAATYELLFRSGFSTEGHASETSGRGVGLSVVRRDVVAMGGTVHVVSEVGVGTRFEIQVPRSITFTQVIIVGLGKARYAVPAAAVQGLVPFRPEDIETVHDRRVLKTAGGTVPLVSLATVLGLESRGSEEGWALIVETGSAQVAFQAERRLGVHDVVVKPFGRFVEAPLASGACLLELGELIVVLNPNELVSVAAGTRDAVRPPRRHEAPARQLRRVLLVEDAEITRTMIVHLLRGKQYEVLEATDGVEALKILAHSSVDVILTDIDMPRMNGIEFVERVRSSSEHRDLPIVVLSTRGKEEDIRKAVRVGADDYIVKMAFSERALLDAINRRLGAS